MPQFATTEADLEALYGPRDTPVATIKEIDHISNHYRMFIDASPFVVVATVVVYMRSRRAGETAQAGRQA